MNLLIMNLDNRTFMVHFWKVIFVRIQQVQILTTVNLIVYVIYVFLGSFFYVAKHAA